MCGRFTLNIDETFPKRFDVSNQLDLSLKNNNIYPGSSIPIIFHQGANFAQYMQWGLIPFWAKDSKIGVGMFNARAETVASKPSFRKAFKTQRCLVPANGFYERQHYFSLALRPLFAFAGLYDVWEEPVGGKEIYTYTIITTTPNDIVKPFHDRMPVILRPEDETKWLSQSTEPSTLEYLLQPSVEEFK